MSSLKHGIGHSNKKYSKDGLQVFKEKTIYTKIQGFNILRLFTCLAYGDCLSL